MFKFRVTQFLEIFLASSILASFLFRVLPLLPMTISISLFLLVTAMGISFWVWWWLDTGRSTFPEISLIAVAVGVLIGTWF